MAPERVGEPQGGSMATGRGSGCVHPTTHPHSSFLAKASPSEKLVCVGTAPS